MTSRSPRLTVLTGSSGAGAQRAERVAVAAAIEGWDVQLIGRSPTSKKQRAELGAVQVIRVPVAEDLARAEEARRAAGSRLLQPGARPGVDRSTWHATYRARSRIRTDRIARLDGSGGGSAATRLGLRGASYLDQLTHRARLKLSEWDLSRRRDPQQPIQDWRRDEPGILDLDLALGPATERFEPDLIHACGVDALYPAVLTAGRLRRSGHTVHVIYDADCFVPDHVWSSARAQSAYRQLEQELIQRADAVVTSTPEVAAALRQHYRLSAEPVVVRTAPEGDTASGDTRRLAGLYAKISGRKPTPRSSVAARNGESDRPLATDREADSGSGREPETTWRHLSDTKVRLGLGVANYAGQLAALAHAVTAADPEVSAEVITRTMSWSKGYPSDVYVPGNRFGRLKVQLELVRRVLPRYTHLISDAFLPVFGYLNGTDISGDLPALHRAGIKTALLCHGSEIRDPQRHLDTMPYSLFRFAPPETLQRLRTRSRRNADILARHDLPVFVTTPDLLADVPRARWVPLVVDVNAWNCDLPVMERPRPIVLHAPSARWTKGTDLFLADLQDLADKGAIELRLIEGLSWADMRAQVLAADIVVDQVAIGCYGTLACEAMAAGKPVVVHLSDDVLAAIGEDVPVANTKPTEVRETVERLLDDRAGAQLLAAAARDFTRRVHDGRRSAAVLQQFLRS